MKQETIDSLITSPELEKFARQFLDEYLKDGFGSAPKRATDLHIFHLLETIGNCQQLSNHELSLKLQITESRIKSYRYESKLKFLQAGNYYTEKNILQSLAHSEFDPETKKIKFIIEDSYTRKCLIAAAKKLGSVPDSSFNSEIIVIKIEPLEEVVRELFGERIAKIYKEEFTKLSKESTTTSYYDVKKKFIIGAFEILKIATTTAISTYFSG